MSGEDAFLKDGLIVLDKPAGLTSQDAVSKARRQTGIKKIGHTGTLDKFATGVLPLMAGNCTRISRFVLEGKKRYLARFRFGIETDTLDPEGSVIRSAEVPTRETLEKFLPAFRGEIAQVPPEYSAIHIKGRRAYEIARSGGVPAMEARPIVIYSLELIEYTNGIGSFEIECSKGGYIRSLARDLGRAAGSAAYVEELRRSQSGGFTLADVLPLEAVGPGSVMAFSPEIARKVGLGTAVVSDTRRDDFMNGKKLDPGFFLRIGETDSAVHAVFDSDGRLCGVVAGIAGAPRYEMVMGSAP